MASPPSEEFFRILVLEQRLRAHRARVHPQRGRTGTKPILETGIHHSLCKPGAALGNLGAPQTGTGANSTRGREDSACRSKGLGHAGRGWQHLLRNRLGAGSQFPALAEWVLPGQEMWTDPPTPHRQRIQQLKNKHPTAASFMGSYNQNLKDRRHLERIRKRQFGFVEELDGRDVSAGLQRAPPQ